MQIKHILFASMLMLVCSNGMAKGSDVPASVGVSVDHFVAEEILAENPEDYMIGCWHNHSVVGQGGGLIQNFADDNMYQIVIDYDPDYESGYWKNCIFNIVANDYSGANGTWAYVDGQMEIKITSALPKGILSEISEEFLDPPLTFTFEISDFKYELIRKELIGVDGKYMLTAQLGDIKFWKIYEVPIWGYYDDLVSVDEW